MSWCCGANHRLSIGYRMSTAKIQYKLDMEWISGRVHVAVCSLWPIANPFGTARCPQMIGILEAQCRAAPLPGLPSTISAGANGPLGSIMKHGRRRGTNVTFQLNSQIDLTPAIVKPKLPGMRRLVSACLATCSFLVCATVCGLVTSLGSRSTYQCDF